MRTTRLVTLIAATAATAAGAVALGPAAASASSSSTATSSSSSSSTAAHSGGGLVVVGLGNGGTRLVGFTTDRPGRSRLIGMVTGLKGDARLVGIDFRPADGRLYGLGNRGGLYTLDPTSGKATRFGQLTERLEGTQFGVDVNPAADALRIVSNTGQNLRQSFATPDGPTLVDSRLSTPPTEGDTTGVIAAAYTNNDSDPGTATSLFDISPATDQVLLQSPANSGTLSPTGSLGVDVTGAVGFDIYSVVRGGTAVDVQAFATLDVGGSVGLYRVNLLNGRATLVGGVRAGIVDIAIPVEQK